MSSPFRTSLLTAFLAVAQLLSSMTVQAMADVSAANCCCCSDGARSSESCCCSTQLGKHGKESCCNTISEKNVICTPNCDCGCQHRPQPEAPARPMNLWESLTLLTPCHSVTQADVASTQERGRFIAATVIPCSFHDGIPTHMITGAWLL